MVMKGFAQEELDAIESFLREAQGLPVEEILIRLASLATSLQDRVPLLFFQLEQDIETTLRIPREYLAQKVLNRDISDVPLENLEKVLPLLINKKRQLSNMYYEKLFDTYQQGRLNKEDRRLLKEAKERLKLFFKFQTTIKEVVELHIEIKRLFVAIEPPKSPKFEEPSYLPMFEDLIKENIRNSNEEVKKLSPFLKQPHLLDSQTYSQVMDSYQAELGQDIIRLKQITKWKQSLKNQAQLEYLAKVERKAIQLQRIHRGVLFIAYGSKHNADSKIKTMIDETYALEKRLDYF